MMIALSDTQAYFLETHLGVAIEVPSVAVLALWTGAKDQVDAELRSLSDRLRKSAEPEVQAVADEVEGLLSPLRVTLVGALMGFEAAPHAGKAQTALRKAVVEARSFIESDPRVAAIDMNPWGVPVSIAATLGETLDQIEAGMSGAA